MYKHFFHTKQITPLCKLHITKRIEKRDFKNVSTYNSNIYQLIIQNSCKTSKSNKYITEYRLYM